MRVIDKKFWDTLTVDSTTVIGPEYDVGRCYAGSIQVVWGMSTSGGTVRLQASLGDGVWNDVPNTICTVGTSADSVLWNIDEVFFPSVRAVFNTIGEITGISGRIFMKGG